MVGEDLTSALLAAPPRTPLLPAALDRDAAGLADELERATQAHGMSRWFWGEGVCMLAATRLARARGEAVPPWVRRVVEPFLTTPPVVEHVNNLAPGAALAELHAERPTHASLALLEASIDWYRSSPAATRAPNGALEHWPGGVWADTVYMAGEFLLRAGIALDRPALVDEAVRQWLLHAELLQHPRSDLLVHGTHAGERIDCHWGRANAWFALAGADLLAATGSADVRDRLVRLLLAVAVVQPEHGVWDVLLDAPPEVLGILETSAAAGLGAALLRTAALIRDDDATAAATLRRAGERAVLGALAYVDDGELTRVSAGTVLQLIPFGYSVIRDDRPQPWGQGLAMEALSAWLETAEHRTPATEEAP